MEEGLRKKSELILGGTILVPKDFKPPYRLSRSTAGPGAGGGSIAFEFEGMRVKKSISYEKGDFELHEIDGTISITKNGKPFIDSIKIIPIQFHSPNHAFFNLDQRCIYRCVFCSTPLLDNVTKDLTPEKIVNMVKGSGISGVALTSGVADSVQSTVDKMASCVKLLREEFPDMTIGVEPYIETTEQIDQLKEAGANEIKINREAARKDIFDKVCPELDHDLILNMLVYSVSVFGKGRVASNIIYGLGETDDDISEEMRRLSSIGCIPGLRALRTNDKTRDAVKKAIGEIIPVTTERALALAKEQKKIMKEYDLTTSTFKTMCFGCQCCDLVPFSDL